MSDDARHPLGIRLDSSRPIREQIREAAKIGAEGVVVEAVGDLAPSRLSDTGRREFRHILRSSGIGLIALSLPIRRSFDSTDQLEDRLQRAEGAFTMAYELGASLVLALVGAIPLESEIGSLRNFSNAVRELGRRADHRGTRLALETGPNSGAELRAFLDQINQPGLAASLDPAGLLQKGHDPIATAIALGPLVAHAYASEIAKGGAVARRPGYASGTLDWAEYLGALEEINYRGFMTFWPDPDGDAVAQFESMTRRLNSL